MKTIKLLDAKTYEEMSKTARRQAAKLLKQAERTLSDKHRAVLIQRAHARLGEAVELELRRIAAGQGAKFFSIP